MNEIILTNSSIYYVPPPCARDLYCQLSVLPTTCPFLLSLSFLWTDLLLHPSTLCSLLPSVFFYGPTFLNDKWIFFFLTSSSHLKLKHCKSNNLTISIWLHLLPCSHVNSGTILSPAHENLEQWFSTLGAHDSHPGAFENDDTWGLHPQQWNWSPWSPSFLCPSLAWPTFAPSHPFPSHPPSNFSLLWA